MSSAGRNREDTGGYKIAERQQEDWKIRKKTLPQKKEREHRTLQGLMLPLLWNCI